EQDLRRGANGRRLCAGAAPRRAPLPHRAEHLGERRRPDRAARRLRARAALARPPEHPRPGLLHPRGDDAMLAHATVDKLTALRLPALAEALHRQLGNPEFAELSFEDRLGLLVDAEWTHREQRKLRRRLRAANLRRQASLEDIDWHSPRRGLDKAQLHALATCAWIAEHRNLFLLGPTGIGKSRPVEAWHDVIGEPTLADAICDRLIHTAHVIKLHGPSMREVRAKAPRGDSAAPAAAAATTKPSAPRKRD